MKEKILILRACLVLICILVSNSSPAYDFLSEGIYYTILSGTNNQVEVSCDGDPNNGNFGGGTYKDETIIIPSTVNNNGITYDVVSIGEKAFLICSNLVSVTLPSSIKTIGSHAFYECKKLSSINIPESVESIDMYAFYYCRNLSSIYIPNSVRYIGMSAFIGCSKLSSIVLPNSLSKIERLLFSGCDHLVSVKIPESVNYIDECAFLNCSSLESISLPNSIRTISRRAFDGCSHLTKVLSLIKKPFNISTDVFKNISSISVLQVPKGTKELYQQATGWSNHFSSIEEISTAEVYTLSIKTTGNGSVTYGTTNIKNETKSFQLEEGNSATITISPDNGYKIKSVKVNGTDVTSSVSNNSYTISSISANTTVEVEFEAIPIPTYTLSIKATGNGSATYDGTTAKNSTKSFTLNEGTSATITFAPDNGYRIKSVKVNSTDVTSKVSNNSYTISSISANTTVEVEFEAIPIPTYTLSIKATGNGSATYDGTTAKNSTKTFTLNEGTSANITFSPDNGYRIKNVKVNSTDVTSSVSNNQYTVSNIKANTTVEVEFEAIPIPTYTLSIKATGNGSATYNGTTAKNNTKSFTLNEGTNATITFTPDNGYRIKSVKVNSTDVTSQVYNNSYTISSISANTTIEVEFEATPATTYFLTIKASGNGSVTYSNTVIRAQSKSFTLNAGANATFLFSPDDGYRIKNVQVNGRDVTLNGSDNQYTISNIQGNTTLDVYFETIPIKTYTLTITASGNGSAVFDGETVRDKSTSFSVNEGTNATITFTPDNGYQIKTVKVNGTDVTSSVSNNQYTINNIKANTTVNVEFEAIPTTDTTPISGDKFEVDGITYVVNNDVNTVSVTSGNAKYSGDVAIPSSVVYQGNTYSVTSIGSWAFAFCDDLTSVTIPNSVTSIGDEAFYGCDRLTSVTIPNSVTDIRFEAFRNCGLTSVTIPSSVRSIGYGAFFGCNLTTITSEIENPFEIEEVFSSDAQLIVPKGTKAAYQATEGWNQFANIVEAGDDSTISGQCGENVYYSYDNKTHTLTIYGEGDMWSYDDSLIEPNDDNRPWFSYLNDIINLRIESGVTIIGRCAFDGCENLTSVSISSSVTTFDWRAFAGCSSLPSIIMPNNLTSIKMGAFSDCRSLISILIPKNVTFLDDSAFEGCSNLASITVEDGNLYFDSRNNCNAIIEKSSNTLIVGCKNTIIPNSVISIGTSAFYGRDGLTSMTIPSSVTSIGSGAFYNCGLTTIVSEIENPFEISSWTFSDDTYNVATLVVPRGTKAAYQATEGWNQFSNIVEAGETEPDQPGQIHNNDIIYKVTGSGEAEVVSADNGVTSITIPSTVSHNNNSYKVTAIAKNAFENCEHLAAVIWEPEVQFNAKVNNPNLLLYVNDDKYASRSVKNVVVDGIAESIELTDAASGNDFYCPRAFRARSIVYSHNYQMETGIGDSRGWETIVLPFDVQKYTHATKGELESFTTWSKGSSKKPFWLFELTASGYKDVAGIKANTPYIISMPNNKQYEQQYQIPGIVTFSAENVEVQKSDNLTPASYQTRKFVPNYANKDDDDLLPLNVSNNYVTNPGKEINGSKFVRGLRAVHPFEAYMTTTDNTRTIDVMEGLSTAIKDIRIVENEASVIKVYDTRGILLKTATSMDDARAGLKAGVYIVNGKKMIIK